MQSHTEQLEMAERHVAEGEAHVRRQHEIIAEMDRDLHLHAASVARDVLETMQKTLDLARAHLAELRKPA